MTKTKQLQPLTPAALYARVSSDRQDVDLSVSAQLRALKEYAKANGYSVAGEVRGRDRGRSHFLVRATVLYGRGAFVSRKRASAESVSWSK